VLIDCLGAAGQGVVVLNPTKSNSSPEFLATYVACRPRVKSARSYSPKNTLRLSFSKGTVEGTGNFRVCGVAFSYGTFFLKDLVKSILEK